MQQILTDTTETLADSLVSKSDTIIADSLISGVDTTISEDAIKSKVTYHAKDSMLFDLLDEKVFLFGEAVVEYENISLNAARIELDLANDIVHAYGVSDTNGNVIGTPVFKEGSQEFKSQDMVYNFKTKKGKIKEVKTQEGEGFIKGEEVKKTTTDVLYIRNGYYTTCNLDHPHFSLATSKLKVIPGNKIVTGPTVLKIGDVPTPLGLPFGFFPNKKGRSSGIVIPTYGDSPRLGFYFLDGGFYFGGSEYFDLRLTGDIYSKGSWGARAASNYRKRYKYNGNVSISYANILNSFREFPDFTESKEFFVRWSHRQDAKARPNSRFSANVNVGSRENFTNNFNSFATDFLTNTFQSSITYSRNFSGKPFNFTASARHNQNTQTGAFNVNLPDVSFNVSRIYPLKNLGSTVGRSALKDMKRNLGLSYTSSFTNQLSTNDTLLALDRLDELSKDFRNGFRQTIPLSTSFKLFNHLSVNPSINYANVFSFSTIRRAFNDEGILVTDTVNGLEIGSSYSGSATFSTKLYGMFTYKKGKIQAIRHVFTPQASINYTPEIRSGLRTYVDTTGEEVEYSIFEQSVYGRSDRAKNGSIGINLINNIEMKVRTDKDTSGVKKIKLLENLGFSTNYSLIADSLNWQPINVNARTRINRLFTLQLTGRFDPYSIDDSTGVRLNESHYKSTGKLARLTSGNIALNFGLKGGSKEEREKRKESKFATEEEEEFINNNLNAYVDFNVPWSINFAYNFRYSKPTFEESITQTLSFNGDVKVTENWKVGFNSGWDFESKDFSYTSLNIYRNLHCWEMAINWVPFGVRQSYMVTINVKASVLQDLKLNRRRDYFDLIQ